MAFVGITDGDWFSLLSSQSGLEEINFWQPSGNTRFRALNQGELFLFKLHKPRNSIVGGSFEGDRLRGKVLPGGADWTVKRPDGVVELDLRITLAADDGALIHMTFEGIRDDGAQGGPYFRTLPRFETAEAKYSFLN